MFYGFAIPIMFPITLMAMINVNIMDKYGLCYVYKQPEHVD